MLWDNYLHYPFRQSPGSYQPLSSLDVRGENGEAGGLTATYYAKGDSVLVRRQEADLNYMYLPDLAKLPKGYTLQNGVVRWKGTVASAMPGLYQFLLYFGGYARVWVNGALRLDRWRQCWNPETAPFDLSLEAGKPVSIEVEWKPDGSESFLSLTCLPPKPAFYSNTYSFSSEVGDAVNYYFIKGRNLDEVIGGYRLLTE